jgi:CRP/FNR family transcriptional regulator
MRTKLDILSTLRRLPLFTDLSEQELTLFAEDVTRLECAKGATIFAEGDSCNELLIIEMGAVKIVKSAPNGRQQLLSIERRGSSLAEVPVFDGGNYPASAEAADDVVLLRLPADSFRRICLQNPELSLKVFKVLAHRLRHVLSLVEDLSFSTVRGRLIAHLLRLAERFGRQTRRGIEFELSENNEELAIRLGTVRELISRNLGRLHGAGLIEMQRRAVIIPNPTILRNEIEKNE